MATIKTEKRDSAVNKERSAEIRNTLSDMLKTAKEGKPIYLSQGLTAQHMESLYEHAYNLYTEQKYEEAIKIFQLMMFYSQLDPRGWMGAGLSLEKCKNYKLAVVHYIFSSLLDPENTAPLLHAVNCYIVLKNYPQAIKTLEAIIALAAKDPANAAVKEQAEDAKKALINL